MPNAQRHLASILLLLMALPYLPACAAPMPQPIWADEFEYTGLPDKAKWGYEVGYVRNREWQYYTYGRQENAQVANGVLTITARRDNFESNKYTSASLTTRETFALTYGTIIVRAKLPKGRGTWPAIWLLGKSIDQGVRWPNCGEIDIMENVGYDPNRIHTTIHTATRNHILETQATNSILLDDPWTFHDYKVQWDATKITFFIDDQQVYQYLNDGGGEDTWPFDKPMFLIINLAIGGDWGGQQGVDDALFPAEYQIDYVRIYQ
jgi:beta-glucanase (GH16 family)